MVWKQKVDDSIHSLFHRSNRFSTHIAVLDRLSEAMLDSQTGLLDIDGMIQFMSFELATHANKIEVSLIGNSCTKIILINNFLGSRETSASFRGNARISIRPRLR